MVPGDTQCPQAPVRKLRAINLFQLTADNRPRSLHAPVPWRCSSFQDLLKSSLGRTDGPRWRSPAALGVNLLLLQKVHTFLEASGQSVPANPARSSGAGSQDTRRVSLTLCRKLKRSRSGGTAAMVQVTSQPARFRQASILQSSRFSGSPSQSFAGGGQKGGTI